MDDAHRLPCCPECRTTDVSLQWDIDWAFMECRDCGVHEQLPAEAIMEWTITDERFRYAGLLHRDKR